MIQSSVSTTKIRKPYLDILRILGCAMVIFNHLDGFNKFADESASPIIHYIYTIISIIDKIGVPLFFMISGITLLGKDESIKDVLIRVLRIVVVMLIFGLVRQVYDISYNYRRTGNSKYLYFDIYGFFLGVLSRDVFRTIAYWYLFAYIGFLLSLPLLRKVARQIQTHEFYYLLIIHFVFQSALPFINLILSLMNCRTISIDGHFNIALFMERYLFFPLLGYYIDTQINIKKISSKINLLFFISVTSLVITILMVQIEYRVTGAYSQKYLETFDYVISITVLLFFKVLYTSTIEKGRFWSLITKFSTLTFGIYLLDPIYVKLQFLPYVERLLPNYPRIIVSLTWVLCSMVIGGGITYLLKRLLPFMRKLL